MATKEQLETELAELKAQLAELQAAKHRPEPDAQVDEGDRSADQEKTASEDAPNDELHRLVDQMTGVIDDHPAVKPLLLLLGVFGVGYLLGRSK